MKTAIPTAAATNIHFLLMLFSPLLRKLVVNALQSFAQMQRRVALAREQRIDVHATFCG